MAEVERLVDMIDYQEGSVVSRTLLKKKTGTITLFAFDKGEGLSEHTAPFDALLFVLDGAAEVTVSGVVSRVAEGEMVVLPAGESHAVAAVDRFKMVLTMIRS